MKIRVINLQNGSTVHYPLILIRGLVENYSTEVWRKHSRASHIIIIHSRGQEDSNANQSQKHITEVAMVKLKFKVLLLLHPGENQVKFDFLGVQDNLRIFYRDVRREYFVRSEAVSQVFYIVQQRRFSSDANRISTWRMECQKSFEKIKLFPLHDKTTFYFSILAR